MHPILPLLRLISALSEIEGRKKLQKTVHILKELGVPFAEKFEYSYYGMYSPQLKSEVDSLVEEGLLQENQQLLSTGGTGFCVKATVSLNELLDQIDQHQQLEWLEVAKQLNSYSPLVLEGISTLFFLHRLGESSETRVKELLKLKPHLQEVAEDCNLKFNELLIRKVM